MFFQGLADDHEKNLKQKFSWHGPFKDFLILWLKELGGRPSWRSWIGYEETGDRSLVVIIRGEENDTEAGP